MIYKLEKNIGAKIILSLLDTPIPSGTINGVRSII
jgi:hypothetical protein